MKKADYRNKMITVKNAHEKSAGKGFSSRSGEAGMDAKLEKIRERVKSGHYDLPEVRKALAKRLAEVLEKEKKKSISHK